MQQNHLKVCVLFGGQSSEHDVSRQSAAYIIDVLKNIYKDDVLQIGITKQGEFIYYQGASAAIRNNEWLKHPDNMNVLFGSAQGKGGFYTRKEQELLWHDVDVFFPVLHGKKGEDGTIQGLFEMLNVPYVGCGVLASAVSMDKVASRMLFDQVSIPQAKWTWVRERDFLAERKQVLEKIETALTYPIFVKPANAGSSVGISKAYKRDELSKALTLAFEHDEKAVLEENVNGREIEVAVLEDKDDLNEIIVSVPGEIIPDRDFYDYESKYISEGSKLLIPATVSETELKELKEYAVKAFQTVDGKGLSRVDFFIEKESGKVLLNEINTLPGFTAISMYPKLLMNSGYTEEELVKKLIASAFEV